MLEKLPAELLDILFDLVHPKQLLELRLCSRWLDQLIQSSSFAQYRIECWAAGVIDQMAGTLPYADRLSLLRQREARWNSGEYLKEIDVDVSSQLGPHATGTYDLDGGLLVLDRGDSGLSILKLPSPYDTHVHEPVLEQWRHYEFEDNVVNCRLAVEEADLIAVVTGKRLEDVPVRELPQAIHYFAWSFDLHLLSLSTGHSHPLSASPLVQLSAEHWVLENEPTAIIEVFGDYLIILLLNERAVEADGVDDEMYLVNWKTGTSKLISTHEARRYQGVIVLSEDLVLFPKSDTASLELYRCQLDEEGNPGLIPCGELQLPRFRGPQDDISGYQCTATPYRNVKDSGHSASNDPTRPFCDAPEDALAVFAFKFEMSADHGTVMLIVHRKTLLRAAQAATLGDAVPYALWGAGKCSWRVHPRETELTQESAGQRICTSYYVDWTTETYAVGVRDYNPYNVRRALAQENMTGDTEHASTGITRRIVSDDDPKIDDAFDEFVEGGLPYVETCFARNGVGDRYRGYRVMLDSERLIGVRGNPMTGLSIRLFG